VLRILRECLYNSKSGRFENTPESKIKDAEETGRVLPLPVVMSAGLIFLSKIAGTQSSCA
jgi:hypothetical protein